MAHAPDTGAVRWDQIVFPWGRERASVHLQPIDWLSIPTKWKHVLRENLRWIPFEGTCCDRPGLDNAHHRADSGAHLSGDSLDGQPGLPQPKHLAPAEDALWPTDGVADFRAARRSARTPKPAGPARGRARLPTRPDRAMCTMARMLASGAVAGMPATRAVACTSFRFRGAGDGGAAPTAVSLAEYRQGSYPVGRVSLASPG